MDRLRVEYILAVNKDNTFCNSTKTFNNILTANGEIKTEISKLIYKNLEISYEIKQSELNDKNLRFFYLKFICLQVEKIDEFDDFLKIVRTIAYKTDGQIKTLWDDIAIYYSIKSYPLINEIENLMRRLIIQFLLTTVGIDWDREALPRDLKDNIKKKKVSDKSITSILHETDFIQLADCLFKPYVTKEVELLYKQLECTQDISELKLDDLKKFIPKSNWTRYFSVLVDCEDNFLKKRWEELYEHRCLIAHNNLFYKSNYEKVDVLISEIKSKLQKAIDSLDKVIIPEQEKSNLVENITMNTDSLEKEFLWQFRSLEVELKHLAMLVGEDVSLKKVTAGYLLSFLRKNNILDDDLLTKIEFVLRLRNSVAHAEQYSEADIYQGLILIKDIVSKLKILVVI